MVVGHTPTEGVILPRYDGRLIQIDVGLAKVFGGPPAALVLENGRPSALHRGRLIALPEEPDPRRFAPLITGLERALSATPSLR